MLKIEDLIKSTDMLSIVFRDTLLKIGQMSTDHIFSTPDIASLNSEIFPKIVSPLLQFTDCVIRIKDFNKLSFNFIFLLKDASMRGIQRVIEKGEGGDIKSLSFTRETLITYKKEIDKSNYLKILQFISANRKLNVDTIMNMVSTGLTKIKPFVNYRIESTMADLLNTYFPQWKDYLTNLVSQAIESIAEEEIAKQQKLEQTASIIENHSLFLSEKIGIPRLVDIRNRINFEILNTNISDLTKEDVDKFLLDKDNFTIFQATVTKSSPEHYGTFDGESYKISLIDNNKLVITENTEPLRSFSERKLSYFRECLKPMIIGDVQVAVKTRYDNYSHVYAFYRRKKIDIYDALIKNANVQDIMILSQLLELDKNDPLYKTYKDPLEQLSKSLIGTKVNSLLLDFFREHSKGVSFFSKLFGLFFSSMKESEVVDSLNADKTKVANVTKHLTGTDSTFGGKKNSETPVQSALNILKRSGQLDKADAILNSHLDNSTKVRDILRMCKDIGNTNKAHIEKTDKNKNEFLQALKVFLGR